MGFRLESLTGEHLQVLTHIVFKKVFGNGLALLSDRQSILLLMGKALRGVYDPEDPDTSLILVSAWATDRGILLGQVKTDVKSNEITAIPKLLDLIRIKDCLISIDAIGCQVDIAKKITDLGGEYLFALKGNQGTLKMMLNIFFRI